MPYTKTPILNSANFDGGLLINNAAQVVWQVLFFGLKQPKIYH